MLNKTLLQGRLSKDVENVILPSGRVMARTAVATTRTYRKGDQFHEQTSFIDIKAFGKTATRLLNLNKGDMVLVEGRLVQERWTDQNGENRSRLVVYAEGIRVLKKKTVQQETVGVS